MAGSPLWWHHFDGASSTLDHHVARAAEFLTEAKLPMSAVVGGIPLGAGLRRVVERKLRHGRQRATPRPTRDLDSSA